MGWKDDVDVVNCFWMTLRKREDIWESEREITELPCLENFLWKRLWTCRTTDFTRHERFSCCFPNKQTLCVISLAAFGIKPYKFYTVRAFVVSRTLVWFPKEDITFILRSGQTTPIIEYQRLSSEKNKHESTHLIPPVGSYFLCLHSRLSHL